MLIVDTLSATNDHSFSLLLYVRFSHIRFYLCYTLWASEPSSILFLPQRLSSLQYSRNSIKNCHYGSRNSSSNFNYVPHRGHILTPRTTTAVWSQYWYTLQLKPFSGFYEVFLSSYFSTSFITTFFAFWRTIFSSFSYAWTYSVTQITLCRQIHLKNKSTKGNFVYLSGHRSL